MFFFNPDNDLALANFSPFYTSPASAMKMANDLAILPLWYAGDGSTIIAEDRYNRDFLDRIKEVFSLDVSLISFSDLSSFFRENVIPWGWNPSLRKKLIDAGMDIASLPSLDEVERIREYSSRQNAVRLLADLQAENSFFCGESHYFTEINDVLKFLSSDKGDKVLKMPLSGSGKGLVWIKGGITDKQQDWCKRVINNQGGVVAEPVFDKVQDFAMEFRIDDGRVHFTSYSLFHSTSSGMYAGNRLLSDFSIEQHLSTYLPIGYLRDLIIELEHKLVSYFPAYNGFLGVDMMICRNKEHDYRIHPCVEINMRMNMGLVARAFYDRFVHETSEGIFKIVFFKQLGEALQYKTKMLADYPPIVKDNRIVSGFLPLNPVSEETKYMAFAHIVSV
jgi:hypothetical protein